MSSGAGLMKDDRFLMFAAKHWETMCDDHRYVSDVEPQMWEWLSETAGFSGDAEADLRGQAILVVVLPVLRMVGSYGFWRSSCFAGAPR